MRVVVALGGNALLQRGQTPDASLQEANVAVAVEALAPLAHDHEIVVTHGNGPQIGVLALESASDPNLTLPEEVEHYKPWHRQRLAVVGGMTGLWQVSGRSDLSFDELCLCLLYTSPSPRDS